jgi:bifunctional non-homologous end joining protein LigD
MPRKVPMPDFVAPQHPLLVAHAPRGDQWLHEIKFDGYRVQLRVEKKRPAVRTREGHDWTKRFAHIVAAAKSLPDCIIDGEAVILDAHGHSDFAALQKVLPAGHDTGVIFFAFDLIFERGKDLRKLPLDERKEWLRLMLEDAGDKTAARIHYSSHTAGNGADVEQQGRKLGLEGIVSKRWGSPYSEGKRNDDWQKVKFAKSETFTVGGWRETAGYMHTVLAGEWREGKLHYVGRARTSGDIGDLRERLLAIEIDKMPFVRPDRPTLEGGERWTKPELLCEVNFTARTTRGHIRHGMFKGLRQELIAPKPPRKRRSR